MSSLAEHVDRISHLAQSIRSAAAAAATPSTSRSGAGPFTDAVLHTSLGDLIRDIDPAELGLFTLVPPANSGPSHVSKDANSAAPPHGEITRVAFVGATPLRKPPAPRPGRHDTQRVGEHDPEVYARAALKYLERYQSIRPMPRASEQAMNIIEQLEKVRANIQALNDTLKQHANAGSSQPPLSPKSIIKEEERRIQDVQTQMAELRKRRDALLKQKGSRPTSARGPPKAKPKPNPRTPQQSMSPADVQEETFWNTPGAAARTLHFTGDSLLDENVSLADVSALSFASPEATRTKSVARPPPASLKNSEEEDSDEIEEPMQRLVLDGGPSDNISSAISDGMHEEESDEEEEDEEQTIVLKRPPPPSMQNIAPDQSVSADSPDATAASSTHSKPPSTETPSSRPKVKVTTELECIVARIWATIGEIIMPGHPFDVSGTGTRGGKPPRAKETIAHLQTLSARTPAPASPAGSSLSSLAHAPADAPTAQQVLIAHMLLALLAAPPAYAMPLHRLKDALRARAEGAGLRGVGITRPIYGCVAKRLLKFDRGGREQVVKFDV